MVRVGPPGKKTGRHSTRTATTNRRNADRRHETQTKVTKVRPTTAEDRRFPRQRGTTERGFVGGPSRKKWRRVVVSPLERALHCGASIRALRRSRTSGRARSSRTPLFFLGEGMRVRGGFVGEGFIPDTGNGDTAEGVRGCGKVGNARVYFFSSPVERRKWKERRWQGKKRGERHEAHRFFPTAHVQQAETGQ